ncbi:MAG: hypothetical protein HOO96_31365 [Polyangiaceae bacterium]|nr:hypothetical protein [Polyangiaceae bacterium]
MNRSRVVVLGLLALGSTLVFACSSSGGGGGFGSESSSGASGGASNGGFGGSSGASGAPGPCVPNPGNFEIPGNGCDDDADGQTDNAAACDTGLAVTGGAEDFAKALGICQKSDGTKWGLVSAEFTNGAGVNTAPNAKQHGILPKFGSVLKPRDGSMLGVLSTGYAREYNADSGTMSFNNGPPDFLGNPALGQTMQTKAGKAPTGYPKSTSGCAPSDGSVYDVINARLKIKVPNNAKGLAFDFNFLTSEWPKYLCTPYNDSFIAYLTSKKGTDNISFDSQKNPINVNLGFFDRCTPNVETGCCTAAEASAGQCKTSNVKTSTCPGGAGELAGTGFARVSRAGTDQTNPDILTYCKDSSTGGGGTGWLQTQAPVEPGETITLEFMIWDTQDANLDSSVLLDHFTWQPGEVTVSTGRPR